MSGDIVMEIIRKMRSPSNKVVLQAVEELRAHGWLANGALEGASLRYVHLQGADLHRANLKSATLYSADMCEADLSLADLEGARMRRVNLLRADLSKASLQGADLCNANLNRTRNLTYGQLIQAHRLRGATMPDGRRYDGRLNLAGDLKFAELGGVDTRDETAMAAFYGVPVNQYREGQEWAAEFATLLALQYANVEWNVIRHGLRRTA